MIPVADRLLETLAARDWDALGALFADDATLRMQTPGPLREDAGPTAIASRFRFWFGELDGFELREADAVPVADRVRVHYRVAGGGRTTDHTGYLAVEEGRIAWLVMTCSGFRPDAH